MKKRRSGEYADAMGNSITTEESNRAPGKAKREQKKSWYRESQALEKKGAPKKPGVENERHSSKVFAPRK